MNDQQLYDNFFYACVKYAYDHDNSIDVLNAQNKIQLFNLGSTISITLWDFPFSQPTNIQLKTYSLSDLVIVKNTIFINTESEIVNKLTTVDRNNLIKVNNGVLIYDSDLQKLCLYDSTVPGWILLPNNNVINATLINGTTINGTNINGTNGNISNMTCSALTSTNSSLTNLTCTNATISNMTCSSLSCSDILTISSSQQISAMFQCSSTTQSISVGVESIFAQWNSSALVSQGTAIGCNGSVFTVPSTGWYDIEMSVLFGIGTGVGYRSAYISVNNSSTIKYGHTVLGSTLVLATRVVCKSIIKLTAGDTLQLKLQQNDILSINIGGANSMYCVISKRF